MNTSKQFEIRKLIDLDAKPEDFQVGCFQCLHHRNFSHSL